MHRLIFVTLLLGCGSDAKDPDAAPGDADAAPGVADAAPGTPDGGGNPILDDRPYDLVVPDDYADDTPTPLIVLLHGYSANGAVQAAYFGLTAAADTHDFLLATPNGTQDAMGNFFWNATDACCNFDGSQVDDVAYLTAIIDDVSARFNVDPKRVYLVGHSNGGFMSNRMACERADRIAAIFELAGATWNNAKACTPSEPVNVAHVHGDADAVIAYAGGAIGANAYPSAEETAGMWAADNGCGPALLATGQVDLESTIAGDETVIEAYEECPAGGAVELWRIAGGSHIPTFHLPEWPDAMVAWLYAHPKP